MTTRKIIYPPEIQDMESAIESINVILMGDPGCGKTVMLGSLVGWNGDPKRVLFAATEPGIIAAQRQGSKAKVWRIRVWNDMIKLFEFLEKYPEAFDFVIIDSITDLQMKCLRAIIRERNEKHANRVKLDVSVPERLDHYIWQQKFKSLVTDFTELPTNIIWTSQMMRRVDMEGDDIILPLIEGKDFDISNWTCAQMDAIWCLQEKKSTKDAGKVWRRLLVNEAPPYIVKDRFDCLGNGKGYIDRPDINVIMKLIKDSEKGSTLKTVPRKAPVKKAVTSRRRVSA